MAADTFSACGSDRFRDTIVIQAIICFGVKNTSLVILLAVLPLIVFRLVDPNVALIRSCHRDPGVICFGSKTPLLSDARVEKMAGVS